MGNFFSGKLWPQIDENSERCENVQKKVYNLHAHVIVVTIEQIDLFVRRERKKNFPK